MSLATRFWSRVKRGPGCWEWQGQARVKGYGRLQIGSRKDGSRRKVLAHRLAYELTYGPIPKDGSYHGVCVLHSCDNPICVRPSHLFLGTNHDNVLDKMKKGRHPRARPKKPARMPKEQNPNARLSEHQIKEIRKRYARGGITQAELAKEYGVVQPHISRIVREISWS